MLIFLLENVLCAIRKKKIMEERNHFINELCTILHRNHALKDRDVNALKREFADRSDLTFEEFLIDENIISRKELLEALGQYYNMTAIDVIGLFFDHHLVTMFPKDLLLRHNFIPYMRDGDVLAVIAGDPLDDDMIEQIGRYVSYDVELYVGFFRDIQDEIEEFYDRAVSEVDIPEERVMERERKESLEEAIREADKGLR